MGSWWSLHKFLTNNQETNHFEGDIVSIKSNNNLVISPNRLTAIIGVDNMTIINLDDATLIVPHEKTEEVKDMVSMLKTLNKSDLV